MDKCEKLNENERVGERWSQMNKTNEWQKFLLLHRRNTHTHKYANAHEPSTEIIIIRWVNISEWKKNIGKKRRLKNYTKLAQQQFQKNNKELGALFAVRWHQQIEMYNNNNNNNHIFGPDIRRW